MTFDRHSTPKAVTLSHCVIVNWREFCLKKYATRADRIAELQVKWFNKELTPREFTKQYEQVYNEQ